MQQEVNTFFPDSRQAWRDWLREHHATQPSIWLIYAKKSSDQPGVTYSEAVEEALCFGWIDSTSKPIDRHTYRQFFTRRKPKSGWSKVNKERVQRLTDAGLMTEAGMASIDTAKANGSWVLLDDVEALLVPTDLNEAFQKRPGAEQYFLGLSRSDRRMMLDWIASAKRVETRQKRIHEVVDSVGQGRKPALLQRVKTGCNNADGQAGKSVPIRVSFEIENREYLT